MKKRFTLTHNALLFQSRAESHEQFENTLILLYLTETKSRISYPP